MNIKYIDHIGIAVRSIDKAITFYRDILGMRLLEVCSIERYKLKVAIFECGQTHIEIMEPEAVIASDRRERGNLSEKTHIELMEPESEDTDVFRFLEKRGEGIHHICYGVEDILDALKFCEDNGITLIDRVPHKGEDGRPVAFLHPKSCGGVLIELKEIREQIVNR